MNTSKNLQKTSESLGQPNLPNDPENTSGIFRTDDSSLRTGQPNLSDSWENSECCAKAKYSVISTYSRLYSIQGEQAYDGDMEVIPWFHHLRYIPHHIFFTFHYKPMSFYSVGLNGSKKRKDLIQNYIYSTRRELGLSQKDLNVFTAEEESTPGRVHTHSLMNVRNPDSKKIEQIISALKSSIPKEVESPDIQIIKDSGKVASYVCKTSRTLSEKEVYTTPGYWKPIFKAKRTLDRFGKN